MNDLGAWPGEWWPHQLLLDRAWELCDNVRTYEALYVALAEAMSATLITLDERLAKAPWLRCPVLVPD